MAVLTWKHGKSKAAAVDAIRAAIEDAGYDGSVKWDGTRLAARVGPFASVVHVKGEVTDDAVVLEKCGGLAGGRVLAGTDCPNVAIVSGYSLHRELELLVRAGLTPMDALLAATRYPAERLGKADHLGTIAPGHAADMLVLGADPLADIRNTRRIENVVARGLVYEPDALLEAAREARAAS